MLSGHEFGLLVKGMGVLGHLLDFREFEVFLGQEVVDGLGVFGRDVVDLGEVFLLQESSATLRCLITKRYRL